MKKLVLLFIAILVAIAANAQNSGRGFNYHAVVRNSEGVLLPDTSLELRVCILYILGVSEKNFYILLGNAPSVLTNAKTRANQKLFEKKDARSLKNNLLQSINRA